MKMNLKLRLHDIYGGDGYVRYEDKEVEKLSRKKSKSESRTDTGVETNSATNEVRRELVKRAINTFKIEGKKYFLRLGGAHGKFWGLLKNAGGFMYSLGDPDFRAYKKLVDSIQIKPVWIELKNITKVTEMIIPEWKAKQLLYYDVIETCEIEIVLEFPEIMEERVKRLLEQAQTMSAFNKRRGTFEIVN